MKMKLITCFVLVLITLVACSKQERVVAEEEPVLKVAQKEPQKAPIADKVAVREYVDTLGGRIYHMTIERRPDDTQPVVEDVIGTRFYDNVVYLTVKCAGQEVYRHTFRKKDFMDYLSEDDREWGTLAGMTYYKEQSSAHKLAFGSQVCMPGMDGGALLKLELDTNNWRLKVMLDEMKDVEVDLVEYDEGV